MIIRELGYNFGVISGFLMELHLSWDLFIGVFIFVIVAYSFIVGINGTIKILLSSYIAALGVDGFHSFIAEHLSLDFILQYLPDFEPTTGLVLLKVGVFIILLVLLTIKGKFEPAFSSKSFYSLEIILVPVFGLFCAGLIVGTIILYANSGSIFSGTSVLGSNTIIGLQQESVLIKIFTQYFSLLFSLPILGLILLSVFEDD